MGRGVQIDFTLNPRDFIKGLKLIETSTEDVVDALADVGKADVDLDTSKAERALGDLSGEAKSEFGKVETAAAAAGAEVESELKSGASDAEQAFAGLGSKAKSEIDGIETAARNADVSPDFDDISGNIKSTATSAKQAAGALMGEIADELAESWGEAVRSGDYGDAIRETFSNLAQIGGAAFGPVGAVGGAAASVLLTGLYDKLTDKESQARITEATSALFDSAEGAELSGREAAAAYARGFVEAGEIGSQIQQALGTEDVATAWQEVGRYASETGLTQEQVTRALLGQQGALEDIGAEIATNDGQYQANLDTAGEIFDTDRKRWEKLDEQNAVLGKQKSALTDLKGRTEEQKAANEAALAVDKTRRTVTADISGNTKAAKDNLSATKAPDLSGLVSQTRDARDLAKETREYWDGLGPKSVALDITYRTRNAPREPV